jgi:hypothetical protein
MRSCPRRRLGSVNVGIAPTAIVASAPPTYLSRAQPAAPPVALSKPAAIHNCSTAYIGSRNRQLSHCFTRRSDGKRVENKIPIGLVRDLPDASSAWAEVERLHVPINQVNVRRGLTFGDLAQHYAEHELVDVSESIRPKAHTTIKGYERVLRNRLLPRWGNRIALGIEPLEVEQWLTALKKEGDLANPTLDETRRVMSLLNDAGKNSTQRGDR